MTIEGRINVDALFHDRDGTTAMKVVSLRSSNEYTTGKVAIVSGTAGTSGASISALGIYKDASGETVTLNVIRRVLFSWSGSSLRMLTDQEYDNFKLLSQNGSVASTEILPSDNVNPFLSGPSFGSGVGTGTYTIVVYGE